jgi:hypothetical protein
MWGFGLLRSPQLLLLLPQLGLGNISSRLQAGAMSQGGIGGARCSPSAEGRRPRCLQLSTVPGADPQRSNELLLLATAGEGPQRRNLPGDPAKEEPQPPPQHHVLYFPGDVQVTRGRPGHLSPPVASLGPLVAAARFLAYAEHTHIGTRGVRFRYSMKFQIVPCTPLDPFSIEPRGRCPWGRWFQRARCQSKG